MQQRDGVNTEKKKKQFDELVRRNQRLVRTATDMRDLLHHSSAALAGVVEAAQPISAAHEKGPVEYVIPAAVMDNLKAAHALAENWER